MAGQVRTPLLVKYNFEQSIQSLAAYDAALALLGTSRSLAIATHLYVNGKVITQAPALKNANIEIKPIRSGSLEFPLDILIPSAINVRDGVAAAIFWDFVKFLYARTLGRKAPTIMPEAKAKIDAVGGAVDAAIDRMSTALIDAHRPISRGAKNAVFVVGNNNQITIIDRTSKEFLEEEDVESNLSVFDGSISSFNANSNAGGIFVPDEERVVSFKAAPGESLDDLSRKLIARSLAGYIGRQPLNVRMRGYAVRTRAGDLKRINAVSVRNIKP